VKSSPLRKELARTEANQLVLRARELASGVLAGGHRAENKGSGVEFAGHRAYTPGDDLRRLDRHALLRHKRLLIREFFTDTERAVHLVVDLTSSMHYRESGPLSENPRKAHNPSKAECALLLAAAITLIAHGTGDRVGLSIITDSGAHTEKPRGGREALEQVLHRLETNYARVPQQASSKFKAPTAAAHAVPWLTTFSHLGATLPRGSIVVVLSDFLDMTPLEVGALAALSTRRRTVRVAQILTKSEVDFPFQGTVRLFDPETGSEIETEASSVRAHYQKNLDALTSLLRESMQQQGGSFRRFMTDDAPEAILRALALGETSLSGARQ
jgi:uncharacterized protein (DUF58 family)